ncbi:hypothetical protein [Synechocystis sp. PCC 7509]|uniref:hypothetical protein n=1 Tax=Synechocystis sp. PCC 7509 TaxID=927677 RepID=UPI0002ACBDC6|nr:hypothetical protein [Synechocystis sp. PCC 7509]
MVISASSSVYGDELVTATELNRQPGRILDRAREHPVTITRNDEYFALLPRDDMTFWVKSATQAKVVFDIVNVAYRLQLGEQIAEEHPHKWLKVFDSQELNELITELERAFRLVGSEIGAIDRLDVLIHEWHESALAISSPELAAAFSDEVDEVLLTPIVDSTNELAQS